MSALDNYADVIKRLRQTWLPEQPETLGDATRCAVLALADELGQLQPDAALGALVRQIPLRWQLLHSSHPMPTGAWFVWNGAGEGPRMYDRKATPEAALREALGGQDDDS